MFRASMAVFLLLAAHWGAPAQDTAKAESKSKPAAVVPVPPRAQPPRFLFIRAVRKKANQVTLTESNSLSQEGPVLSRPADRKPVAATKDWTVDIVAGRIFDGAGKPVKPVNAWKRLEIGAVVLVSSDGKKVHSTYRKLLKPETLILVPPVAEETLPSKVPPAPAASASNERSSTVAAPAPVRINDR